MAEKRGGLVGRIGRRTTVEISADGSTYKELPGVSAISIAQGEASSSTTPAFEGEATVVGAAEVGDVTLTISSYIPNHPAWKLVNDARDNGTNLSVRVTTPEKTIFDAGTNSDTVDVTTAGAVTLNTTANKQHADFKSPSIQRGHVMVIDPNANTPIKATIESITLDTSGDLDDVTVDADAIATAVDDKTYKITEPALRWSFSAGVKNPGGTEIGSESPVSSSVVMTPTAAVGLPSIV